MLGKLSNQKLILPPFVLRGRLRLIHKHILIQFDGFFNVILTI